MTPHNQSMTTPEISTIPLAQLIVGISKRFGFSEIVISPGSRNAPLIKSFVADSFFDTYSIIDERSAGFFALGIAQQIKSPVILVCTSGSALLNYSPAVVEAFYSRIPLIVISADRLPFNVDNGDGQVIQQNLVLKNFTMESFELKGDVTHGIEGILQCPFQNLIPKEASKHKIDSIQNLTINHNIESITNAFQLISENHLPIHLNAPFEEPLFQMTTKTIELPKNISISPSEPKNDLNYQHLIKKWYQYENRWVLMGVLTPGALNETIINALEQDSQTVVLTETTSNVHGTNFIYSIDSLLFPLELSNTSKQIQDPDIVLTIGGMIISKKVKAYLRSLKSLKHWHLGNNKANNTFYCLEHHINCHPNQFLAALYSDIQINKRNNPYKTTVFNKFNYFKKLGDAFIEKLPFSDIKVFDVISQSIPTNSQVHFSNSAIIRYAQLFQWDSSISIYCNRGVSGIEGSISSAVGASLKSTQPTVIITGDLSFFYDANGLWNKYIKSDFRIIIINNQGGGIFRILPTQSKDTPVFDQYIETIHHRKAQCLANDYGFEYQMDNTLDGLEKTLTTFYKPSSKPKILEIITPRKINDLLLLDYFKVMAEKEYSTKKYFV
ncbi:MAG: thiamine pyrophosphate-binding protein [Flavobacteriaceae bacterium]|nr:thiamine pyrophosphate-binding protein [Flavobacteriaceae bacterium]MCY4254275.1 thiamine pyrophosphate-binding protein [Flavobacteriaceae bacterium]